MHPEILHLLQARISYAQETAPLAASGITLIAASKQQEPPALKAAIHAGITNFGENRVQETEDKWPSLLAQHPMLKLHLIGPLQRNKARAAVTLFNVIHTVDRIPLAESLAVEMARQDKRPDCFIQVNTGEEPQKTGVPPQDAEALIKECRRLGLPLVGLMCVPPAHDPPAPHFAILRKIALAHGLTQLSMGMTADFETAIRFGATHIRIGTALFGERKSKATS